MPHHRSPDIRLVAVDLDGTLLDDTKEIGPRCGEALRCAAAGGVKVVLASARPPRGVRPFYDQLGLDTWQVNYNGALIWDEPRRRPIYHLPMDAGLVLRMARMARAISPEVLVSCEVIDRSYTDRYDPELTVETGRLFPPDLVAPLESFIDGPITKLMLLARGDVLSRIASALAESFSSEAKVIHAEPQLVQILARGGSKAAALERVAASHDIEMEQVLALGDAVNDLEMLEAAGVSVAVANAHPALKAAADWIAPSNNEDGVYAALRHYGLCGP